jgi:hypothetical protein
MAKALVNDRSSSSRSPTSPRRIVAFPEATCSRFRRDARSICVGERSIAVIVPSPSRSQISETATPPPQPISSSRSSGWIASFSTAQRMRSGSSIAADPSGVEYAARRPSWR